MRGLVRTVLVASVLWLGGGHGCASPIDSGDESPAGLSSPPPVSLPATVSSPVDLAGVMDRVHFAFRGDGAAFTGGDVTYSASARADGEELRIVPRAAVTAVDHESTAGAPLSLRTRTIGRSAALEAAPASLPRLTLDGGLAIDRGLAVEHLANTEAGVEQSWTFRSRPPGEGDLSVRLAATGQSYAGASPSGLHFLDPASGLGVRYGRATWIDARGARSDVDVTYDSGAIVLTVPAAIVDASTYPAVLDPVVGPESGTDNPVQRPAPYIQGNTSIACSPSTCLLVWGDKRDDGTKSDIFAARIDPASGTILDPTGIAVAIGSTDQRDPEVAWGGNGWLVAWQEDRASPNIGQIYASRVTANGTVLEPGGLPIATGTDPRSHASVAFDGTSYLVVWQRTLNDDRIEGARVSTSGVVLDPAGIPISVYWPGIGTPAVAYNGTSYLVTWANTTRIEGTRVSTAGTVLDPVAIVVFDLGTGVKVPRTPDVASDGTDFFVTWSVNTSPQRIAGARVTAAGAVLDPAGITLSTAPLLDHARVDFGGGSYAVVWDDFVSANGDGTVRAARVTPGGAVLDPAPGASIGSTPEAQLQPAIAFAGAGWLAAWTDRRLVNSAVANQGDVFAARLAPDFSSFDGSGFLVSAAANDQTNPAIAYNGAIYLAVWEDARPGSFTELYATRLSPAGDALDPQGILVSSRPQTKHTPAVASDGVDFLVAWEDGYHISTTFSDLYATLVTAGGAVSPSQGVPVHAGDLDEHVPAIAFDGANYLVVYQEGSIHADLRAARVSPTGIVLDPNGFPIANSSSSSADQGPPAVAFDGTNYLVVWAGSQVVNYDIWGARVTPAGSVLDVSGFNITAAPGTNEARPAIASAGGSSLLVYEQSGDILGAIVTSAGVVQAKGLPVSKAANVQSAPTVAWDGALYWSAWQDARFSTSDILGARLSTAGALLDANGFIISSGGPSSELAPKIARGPAGEMLVAYHRFAAEPTFGSARVRARIVKGTSPQGAICAAAVECESGQCVDGVCCESACATPCMACTASKTGALEGACAPVKNGTDPDLDCADDGLACTSIACQAGACVQTIAPGSCVVGGACFAAGATDPANACASCAPAISTASFTPKPDGVGCASDGLACTIDLCQAGACAHPLVAGYCVVAGACVPGGAADPANPCASCQPSSSPSAYSPRPDGAACPDDGVACTADACQAGACAHSLIAGACLVGGACWPSGAANPANPCEACDPAASTSGWSARPDGSACAPDALPCTVDVCQAGACAHPQTAGSCLIAGACFAVLAINPANPCEACDPAASASAWTARPDGSACTADKLACTVDACQAGACAHPQKADTCLISGVCWAAGDNDPADACSACAPGASATAWTSIVPCALVDAGVDGGSAASSSSSSGSSASTGAGGSGGAGGQGSGESSSSGSSGGAEADAGATPCTPAESIPCACPGGVHGTQVCKSDGAGYEACLCDGAATSSTTSGADGITNGDAGCGCHVPADASDASDHRGLVGLLVVLGLGARMRRTSSRRSV
jgi:MYXO-CTERM domain-containing protein